MRQIARTPRLLRLLVLVLAAMVLTLEVRDGRMVDPRESTYVSLASTVVAEINAADAGSERPGETGGQSVHCRYACLRAAVPRPRLDDLWPIALLVVGLVIGLSDSARRSVRTALPAPDATATGADLLLRLCVCRR